MRPVSVLRTTSGGGGDAVCTTVSQTVVPGNISTDCNRKMPALQPWAPMVILMFWPVLTQPGGHPGFFL